jgi:hypothetical protein
MCCGENAGKYWNQDTSATRAAPAAATSRGSTARRDHSGTARDHTVKSRMAVGIPVQIHIDPEEVRGVEQQGNCGRRGDQRDVRCYGNASGRGPSGSVPPPEGKERGRRNGEPR